MSKELEFKELFWNVQKVSERDFNKFIDYVLSFYAPGEIYGDELQFNREEVVTATKHYIENADFTMDFEGDSIDRENVRDIVIFQRQSNNFNNIVITKDAFERIVDTIMTDVNVSLEYDENGKPYLDNHENWGYAIVDAVEKELDLESLIDKEVIKRMTEIESSNEPSM